MIHLIYIHEKINIINYYVIPFVRNGMGADADVGELQKR